MISLEIGIEGSLIQMGVVINIALIFSGLGSGGHLLYSLDALEYRIRYAGSGYSSATDNCRILIRLLELNYILPVVSSENS